MEVPLVRSDYSPPGTHRNVLISNEPKSDHNPVPCHVDFTDAIFQEIAVVDTFDRGAEIQCHGPTGSLSI